MNKLMIAQIVHTKQQDSGEFKRVREQYIVPGDTYSTAEEYVFRDLTVHFKGEVILDYLKREEVEDVLFSSDGNIEDTWYKCKVSFQDPESSKDKKIVSLYYVNTDSIKKATEILEDNLRGTISDFEIKSITISPIIDIFIN